MVERLATGLSSHRSYGSSLPRRLTSGLVLRDRRRRFLRLHESDRSGYALSILAPRRGSAWVSLAGVSNAAVFECRDSSSFPGLLPASDDSALRPSRRGGRPSAFCLGGLLRPLLTSPCPSRRVAPTIALRRAWRSPTVSRCVLGSGPAGFTLVVSE